MLIASCCHYWIEVVAAVVIAAAFVVLKTY